jgi:hypothetical protein
LTSKLFTVVKVDEWNEFISKHSDAYDQNLKFDLETDMDISVDDEKVTRYVQI